MCKPNAAKKTHGDNDRIGSQTVRSSVSVNHIIVHKTAIDTATEIRMRMTVFFTATEYPAKPP